MKINIDKDTLEFLENINVPENAFENLINVLLIEGIDRFVKEDILIVDENKKIEVLTKIFLLKINSIPKVLDLLKKQVRSKIMNIEIANDIIEILRPVTAGDEDLKSTINILILNGIEKNIEDGFTGIELETVEKLQEKHIISRLIKDLTNALNDD